MPKKKGKGSCNGVTGRPRLYSPELAARACELIATHAYGLKTICNMYDEMPSYETIYQWAALYPEFNEKYRRARELQQDACAEEMKEIAYDDSGDMMESDKGFVGNPTSVSRAKLKIETLKWQATRLAPKTYGDKMQQEISLVKYEDALRELE